MEDGRNVMIEILYEDNHLLVLKKPANILTQSDKTGEENLLDMAKAYLKEKYHKPGEAYLGMVHRLDRPVGGVILFAKTSKAAGRLSEQWRNQAIEKYYYGVVLGEVTQNEGTLTDYLYKDRKENLSHVVSKDDLGAKLARLKFETIAIRKIQDKSYSLLKIKLLTGRSHQIRLQLAHFQHPLYGDYKYGLQKQKSTTQLALWSHEIQVLHPTTKEKLKFHCVPDATKFPWEIFGEWMEV